MLSHVLDLFNGLVIAHGWIMYSVLLLHLDVGFIALCVFMSVLSFACELPCLIWAGGNAVLWWSRM